MSGWRRYTRYARWLAWASLAWMTAEGTIGLLAGITAGSIALTGWALGSAIEGLASVIVVWRFTGARAMSESAEQRAQRRVAISFWLLAPYIASQAVETSCLTIRPPHRYWASHWRPAASPSCRRSASRSSDWAGPCARRDRRRGNPEPDARPPRRRRCSWPGRDAAWPAAGPVDPVALGIAAWSAWAGRQAWRGEGCC